MLNKILKITATITFIVALAVNTTVSYNDPFEMMSLNAIATGTDTSSTGGTTGNNLYEISSGDYIGPAFYRWVDCPECSSSGHEDIRMKLRPVEMICEDPGDRPCSGTLNEIITIDPCINCDYQMPSS